MQIDLSHRTAVVSGSTAGIGFAVARGLAAAGARVVVNGRDAGRVGRAVEALARLVPGAELQGVAADLAEADGAAALRAAVPQADILINNLGMFDTGDPFAATDDDWLRFFRVNVLSAVRLARHYAPGMAALGWGRVLFVSSESALQPTPDMVPYAMSKAALLAVSRGMAAALAGSGVTVNALVPGPTRSDGVLRLLQAQPGEAPLAARAADFMRQHRPSSLLGRLAEPDEVAALAVYLASPQASATTGAALRVDGGVWPSIV